MQLPARSVLLFAAACGSAQRSEALSDAPSNAPPSRHADSLSCPLRWAELDAAAPAMIRLESWPTSMPPDECPDGFDPTSLLAPGGCVDPDCVRAKVSPGGAVAALAIEGPAGSGRYAALGYAIDHGGPRFACVTASTVGWRRLYEVGDMLAPLPWLEDVDHDGAAEVIVWQRVAWGDSELDHGLVPVPYTLVDAALVRREVAGSPPARRVAAAYRRLSAIADEHAPVGCYEALATALDPRH